MGDEGGGQSPREVLSVALDRLFLEIHEQLPRDARERFAQLVDEVKRLTESSTAEATTTPPSPDQALVRCEEEIATAEAKQSSGELQTRGAVVTTLSDQPTLKDIVCHAEPRVAAKWYNLGLALDVKRFVLEGVAHQQEKVDRPREMFAKWLEGSPGTGSQPRTWQTVLDAVGTICGSEAVEDIRTAVQTPRIPTAELSRKRRRSSTRSSDDLALQQSVAKKSLPDHMSIKMDLLARDMSDLRSESDPEVIIKLLYGNTFAIISDLLEPHLKAVKKAAGRYHHLGVHHVAVGEDIIESADSIDCLMSRMSVGGMWDQTRFLRKAIASLPHSSPERVITEAVLSHYHLHLDIYERTTRLKNALTEKSDSVEEVEASMEGKKLVPLELTSSKAFDSFSCEDCHILQMRGLSGALGIPEEKIICHDAKKRKSTTVTFTIPRQYVHDVIQHSAQLDAVWILLELDIIEVSIPGVFTFIPSVGCFLSLLRGSTPFTADLLGVTEVLPYQTYCLLDPNSEEPLSGRPLSTKRIEQDWDSHGDLEPDLLGPVPESGDIEILDTHDPDERALHKLYGCNLLMRKEYKGILDACSKEDSKTLNRLIAISRRPPGFTAKLAEIFRERHNYLADALEEALAEVNSQPRPDLVPTPDPSRDVHPASSGSTVTSDPMSKWNVDALVALKGKLKENVRMFELANYLETPAGGFMNRAEAQSVRAKTEDAQQIEQVIHILQGKGDKEFATFCQMLRKSNYHVWARQLELKAEMFKTSDADPSPNPAPLPQNIQRVPSQQPANTTTHPPSPTLNNMCWPELQAFQDEFSTLVGKLSETLQTLEQRKFDSLLVYLNERLRPMVDGYLPTQGAPSLPNGPTPSELIPHLQNYNYWSYLNPDLLESIIKHVSGVGSPLASLMAEYKKSFRTKVTDTLKECKRNNVKPEPPPHYTTLHHHSCRDQQQGISDHRSFHLYQILQVKDLLVQNFGMSDALFKKWRTEMTARYAGGPIFTDEDVHRLLDEERGDGEQGGWSLASQSDNVEVWRKAEEGVPVHLLKGTINFPGIPHTAVVDMILDVEHRREWDRVFNEIAILEETNDYKIMYWCIRSPLVSNRSLIQYVKDFEDKKNNAHYILCKNYSRDHRNAPDMSGTVRAETIFAGVIVRPDADHPDSTRLSMLFQVDLKGWIPAFIVNLFSARAPKQWQEQVTEYYHNGYHQRKK